MRSNEPAVAAAMTTTLSDVPEPSEGGGARLWRDMADCAKRQSMGSTDSQGEGAIAWFLLLSDVQGWKRRRFDVGRLRYLQKMLRSQSMPG